MPETLSAPIAEKLPKPTSSRGDLPKDLVKDWWTNYEEYAGYSVRVGPPTSDAQPSKPVTNLTLS